MNDQLIDLFEQYSSQVDTELGIPSEEHRRVFLESIGKTDYNDATKNKLTQLGSGKPEELFKFGYEQYVDETSPLHNISIPLIKISGLMGFKPGLILTASNGINRLDPNELAYGLALLNRLCIDQVAEAKLIMGYIQYSGHRNLGIEPNFSTAACLFAEIIGEECFLNDGAALTMLANCIETGYIAVGYNYLDDRNERTKLKMTISEKEFMDLSVVVDGTVKSEQLYAKASEMGVPMAICANNAYKGNKKSQQIMAESFTKGFYLANKQSDDKNADLLLAMCWGGSGHWKGNFETGCILPVSKIAASKWTNAIQNSDTENDSEQEAVNEAPAPQYSKGTIVALISAVLIASVAAWITSHFDSINFILLGGAALLVGLSTRVATGVKNAGTILISGIGGVLGAFIYVSLLDKIWNFEWADGTSIFHSLIKFIIGGAICAMLGVINKDFQKN